MKTWNTCCRIGLSLIFVASSFVGLSGCVQYEQISTAIARSLSPKYNVAPDLITVAEQSPYIEEYRRLGFTLKCYGDLRRDEKISPKDDYVCWAPIKTAYDNVPARLVTFFFQENRLHHVRVELPPESFPKLQQYLSTQLGKYRAVNKAGSPNKIWITPSGIVIVDREAPKQQPVILLWTSKEALGLKLTSR